MKKATDRIIIFAGLAIALLCTVLSVVFAINNGDVKVLEYVKVGGLFDATFWILLCLIAFSIAAILFFLIVKLAKNFVEDKNFWKKFLGIVVAIVVVCVVAFLVSKGNDVNPALMEKHEVTESTSKLIGAACYIVYILVAAAAIAIVYTEVAKSLKK